MADKATAREDDAGTLSGREVIARARRELEELMGRPVEAVLGMQRDGEGWVLTAEVVELRRVPASTDVLGSYEVTVDSAGDVVGYRRTRRYYRNQPDEA